MNLSGELGLVCGAIILYQKNAKRFICSVQSSFAPLFSIRVPFLESQTTGNFRPGRATRRQDAEASSCEQAGNTGSFREVLQHASDARHRANSRHGLLLGFSGSGQDDAGRSLGDAAIG